MTHAYHHLYGIDATILRFFTVYGPAGRPDLAIFRFVQWAMEGRPMRRPSRTAVLLALNLFSIAVLSGCETLSYYGQSGSTVNQTKSTFGTIAVSAGTPMGLLLYHDQENHQTCLGGCGIDFHGL